MKIAILFGDFVCPRKIDFNDIWTNSRGLSGSDLGVLRVAEELSKRHEVSLFVNRIKNVDTYKNIKLYDYGDRHSVITSEWDVIISWCEPDSFRGLPKEPLRICSEQLNGFSWCDPDFDAFVDLWFSPSKTHMEYQKSYNLTDPAKWSVIPNGCDPHVYSGEKVPGRVIWASSADRGLHWLLQEWPKIKKSVPEAHLKIFYNFNYGALSSFEKGVCQPPNNCDDLTYELANRIRYIEYALPRLKHLDVELVGSVSRERINREMSEAMVLAYPVSTVRFCEGFSVTILEACAAGACPIISDVDSLGEIYGGIVPMIKAPVNENMGQFSDLVIKALIDDEFRSSVNAKTTAFAQNFTWESVAKQYEDKIIQHDKIKKKVLRT